MKKICKIFLILCLWISSFFTVYGASGDIIKVNVTEKIPWGNCVKEPATSSTYTCTIKPWFTSILEMLGQIIRWFTGLAALSGVLFIVINGILLSSSGWDGKAEIKTRIEKGIKWMILLLLSGLILYMIAPWVYTF